ncbi:UDP-glucose 4-epimerase GalE [Clostridium aminobutyricum]|uniref:UDP-glucose 4-epimerase n=1 Tax=Clostridium aminobutyricum TaxID=33953 RepID=A0A939IJG6_CLOAM|nr:UDP-glucose 4-epimerase GalE [Clostridium aminobutyricum]MBN7774071.1 UDP-glucose 4-epimerase GalE [Clostridium aminobutyricum]
MAILVTGGTGYIGSHTVIRLLEKEQEIVIIDNLFNSKLSVIESIEKITQKKVNFYCGDVCNRQMIRDIFMRHNIKSVVHFAGLKAVGESVEKPLIYYHNNIMSTLSLLAVMDEYHCKRLVFSSSATVYQDAKTVLPEQIGTGIIEGKAISEDFPLNATNPYGMTKLMIEQVLRDIYMSDNQWDIVILRYFNPIGAHESGLIGEDPNGIPNNLMPYILEVAKKKRPYLNIFGNDYPTKDGTGVRDYIHVMDLADGHVKALEHMESRCGLKTYNLGTGKGYSVLELVNTFKKVSGVDIPYRITGRRLGDIASCYANPSKAEKELRWKANYSLEDMCRSAWKWATVKNLSFNGDEENV